MKIDTKTAWIIGLAGIPLMIYNFNYLFERKNERMETSRAERELEEKTDSVLAEVMASSRREEGMYRNGYLDIQWSLPPNGIELDYEEARSRARRTIDSMDIEIDAGSSEQNVLYFFRVSGVTHQATILDWYAVEEEETFNLLRKARNQEMKSFNDSEKAAVEWTTVERESPVGPLLILSGKVKLADSRPPFYFWECCIIRNGIVIDIYLVGPERGIVDNMASTYLHSIEPMWPSNVAM